MAGAVVVLLLAAPAAAQVSEGAWRGFISINGGLQPSTSDFSDTVVFAASVGVYTERVSGAAAQEPASFTSTSSIDAGTVFDVSGGVRLWRTVGIGVGVSRAALDVEPNVSAQVPHRFVFGRGTTLTQEWLMCSSVPERSNTIDDYNADGA